MGGGEPQQRTIEPDHIDHESHFSWHHIHTQVLCGVALTAIASVVVALIRRRKGRH